ncbi:MAG: metallopeptidase TldD-related protein, partial [Parvibaculales bacterium]
RDQMGQQVMSKAITIHDDPLRPRGLRSAGFDGEGVKTEKLTPVDKGVLQCWWLDSAAARQLETETNGRAARGIGGPPSPSSTNLYMQAGEDSVDTMLKNIGSGFYVTELIGMGVNGVTGDYSRGASGFWIENGEIAYPVSEMTIAGNLKEMFLHMTPADDLQFRRGVNAPTILVEGMALAGL